MEFLDFRISLRGQSEDILNGPDERAERALQRLRLIVVKGSHSSSFCILSSCEQWVWTIFNVSALLVLKKWMPSIKAIINERTSSS